MKCGNYYNHWHQNDENEKHEVVGIHLYPEIIKSVYKNEEPEFLNPTKNSSSNSILPINETSVLKPQFDSLTFYFDNPQFVDDNIISLKVKELINLLYKFDSNKVREVLSEMFNPVYRDFKKIISNYLYEELSIEQLAHLTSLSVSSFKRKFTEIYNESPASYIKNKRLEKAASLLKVSQERINDICYDCGFSSMDNFSKSFKIKYSVTPTEYRNNPLN